VATTNAANGINTGRIIMSQADGVETVENRTGVPAALLQEGNAHLLQQVKDQAVRDWHTQVSDPAGRYVGSRVVEEPTVTVQENPDHGRVFLHGGQPIVGRDGKSLTDAHAAFVVAVGKVRRGDG
jgi:hypothetical protein